VGVAYDEEGGAGEALWWGGIVASTASTVGFWELVKVADGGLSRCVCQDRAGY
jgi:hypothetical protein